MKKIWQTKQSWWLLVNLAGLALYQGTKGNRAWMNAFTQGVTTPLRIAIAQVTYLVSWSVMEVLYTLVAGLAILYLGHFLGAIATEKGRRWQVTRRGMLTMVNAVLTGYLSFCFFWGLNYYTDGFQEKAGLYARGGTLEELTAVTTYFAQELSGVASSVKRDENGLFDESQGEIFALSTTVYDNVENMYPFLAFEDKIPKPMVYSHFMSQMNFTGFYCGYTGESNLNVDSPLCMLPSTIAHELAHQRAIASEQEANFLAVLASTTCEIPMYEYSGYLMGFVYLSNALYAQDYETWRSIYASLPESVLLDLSYHSYYWNQYKTVVAEVGKQTYDAVLKSYGQVDGIQSYGTVVDLLLAYYVVD